MLRSRLPFPIPIFATILVGCGATSNRDANPEEYDENGNWIYSSENTHFEDEARSNGYDSYEDYEAAQLSGRPSGEADNSNDNEEVRGGETYPEYDARRDSYGGSRGNFGDYGCTVDCGGHDAGYDWAQERNITDPDQCGGNSWSFEEGCRAYAEENGG